MVVFLSGERPGEFRILSDSTLKQLVRGLLPDGKVPLTRLILPNPVLSPMLSPQCSIIRSVSSERTLKLSRQTELSWESYRTNEIKQNLSADRTSNGSTAVTVASDYPDDTNHRTLVLTICSIVKTDPYSCYKPLATSERYKEAVNRFCRIGVTR